LHEHPADGCRGVEGFGRGAERDAGLVELVDDLAEDAQAAGDAVDAVDEQDVVALRAGVGEGLEQAGGSMVAPERRSE